MWKTLHSSVSDECTKRWKNLVRLFSHYSLAVFMKSSGALSWDAPGDVHVFKPSCCGSLSIQTFFLISLKQYVFLIFSRNKSIPLIKYIALAARSDLYGLGQWFFVHLWCYQRKVLCSSQTQTSNLFTSCSNHVCVSKSILSRLMFVEANMQQEYLCKHSNSIILAWSLS